jgi:hypothetical protein
LLHGGQHFLQADVGGAQDSPAKLLRHAQNSRPFGLAELNRKIALAQGRSGGLATGSRVAGTASVCREPEGEHTGLASFDSN